MASNIQTLAIVDILGLRTFPYENTTMNICDEILSSREYHSCVYLNFLNGSHPNVINEVELKSYFNDFFKNYLNDGNEHWVITHDGVIAFLTKTYEKEILNRDSNNDLVKNNSVKTFKIQTLLTGD